MESVLGWPKKGNVWSCHRVTRVAPGNMNDTSGVVVAVRMGRGAPGLQQELATQNQSGSQSSSLKISVQKLALRGNQEFSFKCTQFEIIMVFHVRIVSVYSGSVA